MAGYINRHRDVFHEAYDIRRHMFMNPAEKHGRRYKARYGENGTHHSTQMSLLDDHKFFPACRSFLHHIRKTTDDFCAAPMIHPIFCTAGSHRSDGTARAVSDRILNNLEFGDGERMVNAKVFTVKDCDTDGLKKVVKEAEKWLTRPWKLEDPRRWGERASQENDRAVRNLNFIDDLYAAMQGFHTPYLTKDLEPIEPMLADDIVAPRAKSRMLKPKQPGCPPPSNIVNQDRSRTRDRSRSTRWRSPMRASPPPDSPRRSPQPRSPLVSIERDQSDKRYCGRVGPLRHQATCTPSPSPRRSPTPQPQPSRPVARADPPSHIDRPTICTCCDGTGWMESSWDSYVMSNDPMAWANLLKTRGVDESAAADFFVLAKSSEGYDKAMNLLHKVIKKSHSGYECRNPSAFLVNGIKNAWHSMSN